MVVILMTNGKTLQRKLLDATALRGREHFALIRDLSSEGREPPIRLIALAAHGEPRKAPGKEAVVAIVHPETEMLLGSALLLPRPEATTTSVLVPPDGAALSSWAQFGSSEPGSVLTRPHLVNLIAETLVTAALLGHGSVAVGPFNSPTLQEDFRSTFGSLEHHTRGEYELFDKAKLTTLRTVPGSMLLSPAAVHLSIPDIPYFLGIDQLRLHWGFWLAHFENDPVGAFNRFIQPMPLNRDYDPRSSLAFFRFWESQKYMLPVRHTFLPSQQSRHLDPDEIIHTDPAYGMLPYLLLHQVVTAPRPKLAEAQTLVLDRMKHHIGFLIACIGTMYDNASLIPYVLHKANDLLSDKLTRTSSHIRPEARDAHFEMLASILRYPLTESTQDFIIRVLALDSLPTLLVMLGETAASPQNFSMDRRCLECLSGKLQQAAARALHAKKTALDAGSKPAQTEPPEEA